MIVRDEEELLEQCLDALAPWVEEICIVDTGSVDGTIEIAKRFGARVEHFEWCDDFSAARNACLELANYDWILVVDADEMVTTASGPALRDAIEEDVEAWLVYQDNLTESGDVKPLLVPRLFRNRPDIRFTRPVHESIMESLRERGVTQLKPADVHLEHLGYLPEILESKDKHARNLAILAEACDQNPEDLYAAYKFARSHRSHRRRYLAFQQAVDLAKAKSPEERAEFPFLPLLYDGWIQCLIDEGDLHRALQIAGGGFQEIHGAEPPAEIRWRRGELALRTGDYDTAERLLEACLAPRMVSPIYSSDPEIRGLKPARALAQVALRRNEPELALRWAERAESFSPSDALARCLTLRSLITMGSVSRALHMLSDLLSDAQGHPEVRLLAGELAWSQGEPEAAVELWLNAVGDSDAGHRARGQLIVAALTEGDLIEVDMHSQKLVVREIDTAAIELVAAVVMDKPWERHHAFRAQRLLHGVVAILRDLIQRDAQYALDAFRANAKRYARDVAGLDTILEARPRKLHTIH